MKNILLSIVSLVFFSISANINAQTITCTSKVTKVLDYPSTCGGFLQYKTEQSAENGANNWLCSISEKSDAILISALIADKKVSSRIPNSGNNDPCGVGLPASPQMITPQYISISK